MDIEHSMREASYVKKAIIILFFAAAMAGMVAVLMLIWNAILPEVIGVTEVNYWQMLGILFLSRILFGGSKFGSGKSKHRKRSQMREKYQSMTEEEKEAFKAEWKSRWGKC